MKLTPLQIKMKNWYDNRIASKKFQDEILKIREKCRIPPEGYKQVAGGRLRDLPVQWRYFNNSKMGVKVDNYLQRLIDKFHFPGMWTRNLYSLLFYDTKEEYSIFEDDGICMLFDLYEHKRVFNLHRKSQAEEYQKIENDFDKQYPMQIRISPYANKKDVKQFIDDRWPAIEEGLKRYRKKGILLGKLRTKDAKTEELYKFIYAHEYLHHKEILALVKQNFGKKDVENLDVQGVGKILQIMRKRLL